MKFNQKEIIMKKLIQSISLLLISTAVLSAQPNWNPVIYTNSTTLYAKVTINGLPAQTGDKVAAFVNGECRGVSDVVTNANEGYVTLLIQGESAEENASFKIWSESNDVVYFVNKFVWTNPGNTIGTPLDYFLIEGNGPDWKPVIYTNSTTLYGIVTINNVSAQPGDVVGAFVNGECRGREKVIMNNDTAYVTMLIQGEAVENVSFLIWQASSVKALLVPKHISSDPGGTISLININAVNGLVAFYQFNNNLIDETKNGFDLFGGGLTFVKDRFNTPNTSVAFDGSTSQAEVSNSSSLDFRKNGFTISTWVKYSSNGNAVIFGKHVHGYYNGYFLAAVNNRLQFYVSGIPITASKYSNDNQWHLVTGVYDGMNATLYVDGVQEATQQIPYTDFSPNPVRLGYMQTPGYPERYNGLIDDARLYNVPLSQTDVSNLFTENNWTAQEISIINPTGGQRLKANSFYTIDWTATQFIDSVIIEFTTNNGLTMEVIAPSLPGNSEGFYWHVPKINTTQAKIRVRHLSSGVSGVTAVPFIIDPPKITVTSPNGGETFVFGEIDTVKWVSENLDDVYLEYTIDNGASWMEMEDYTIPAADGKFLWRIPFVSSSNCKVRISDGADSVSFADVSDNVFSIVLPMVKLNKPNGGENFIVGKSDTIKWISSNVANVKLEYTTDNGSSWISILTSTPASVGSFAWTIPNTPSTNCKVKISNADNSFFADTSDNIFSIKNPVVTLLSPNGGEQWRRGSSQKISWTSSDVAKVKIQYSTNDGTTWIVVTDSALASTGSFDWTIPSPVTNQAKVRITDYKDVTVSSQSAAPFTIYFPTVALNSPNGGELWQIGSQKNISWTSTYLTKVKLEYTTDGTIWKLIAEQLDANLNNYLWTIPNDPSLNAKVRISDASDNLVGDTSAGAFTIYQQKLALTSPLGGERYLIGTSQNVSWTSDYVNKVKIEFSQDNGSTWVVLPGADSVLASLSTFAWSPNVETKLAKIRISDSKNASLQSISSAFEIFKPKVTVTAPNGGEQWVTGTTQSIRWTSSDMLNVKIDYSTNNGTNWISVITSVPAGDGSYAWTIPNTPSTNCKVRISDLANGSYADTSDNVFSIILPKVTVTSPNGGEQWIVGATQNITWTSSNVANVKLEYTTNNGTNWNSVLTSTPASAGSFVWTIPNTPSANCKIRISDASNIAVPDLSDNVFSIILPIVTVLRPNGGEVFTVITGDTIKWVSTNITTVKIEFSSDNGLNWETLTNSWAADLESFFWPIEQNQPLSNNCRIKISDASNPAISDMSDQTFSIVGFPSLILTSPGATEKWLANTNHQITWISANLDTIKIEFSSNSGSSWKVIAENIVAENGTYTWSTAESPTTQAVIRISPRNNEFPWSASGNFTIYKEALTVISPNGGERLKAKTFVPITWNISEIVNPKTLKNKSGEELNTASAPIQNVKIEFTSDNGLNWNSIVNSVGASLKSYNWQVPVIESKDCKIKITDVDDATHADTSDAVFEIYNPQLLVTAPNGGEILVAGKTDTIKWTSSNIANIKLEFTSDNGSNWNSIITSTPASSGNYVWTIPSPSSKNCKVRISDVLNPEMTDISDGVFTIITPTITLSSPNGGEKWLIQTNHQISWTSADLDSIRIDYSLDNGTTWNIIAPKVFAWDAIYNWNVESLPSSQALIRVSKYDDLSVQDVSDNTFTIYKEALAVISPNGGERLRAKTIVPVTWNISDIINPKTRKHSSGEGQTVASAPIQNVKIEFSSDNGKSWNSIVNSVSAALKSYNWEISTVESKECRIRIVDVDDASHADTSDGVFEIYTPKLIVTSPNGGEKWRAATNNRIEWISTEVTKVKIEYSTNEGFAWKTISDSIEAASGRIDWTIPSERTTKARVRVTDITLASTSDTSDNAFTIVVPEITLTSPIGGETWKTNTVQQIKWNSLDVELVSVEYSSDGGTSWLPIKDSVLASTGVYNWTIPRTPTEQAKVRVSDVNYKEIASTSSLFTIIKPLVLLSPKGGEKWFSGSVQQIKWNYISVDSIKLEFSLNNGVSWQTIANSLPASLLTYDWNIPQNIASNQCKVKITDRNNFLTADSTVEVFTIMTPTLTVLTPNGEENFKGGSTYEITWKNENSDSLVIDYSIDNGATWTSIAKSTNAKAEKFTWVIPKVTSTQCRIRVIDKFYTTVGDTSDKAFSIYTPMITVITPKGGETWFVGETKQIKWKSSFVESVKIVLTTDDGNSWRTLTNSFAASDSIFSLFIEKTPSLGCRIKISAVEDSSVIDSSRSNFAIVVLPPTIYVSILQNPVLTQYCNVVLITDSLLSALPTTTVWRAGENEIPVYEMKPIPNSANAYECSIKFDTTAIYNIALHVISKMGIEKDTLRQFAVGVALPTLFAKVTSKNAGLTLTINPGVVEEKTFFSIEEENVNKEIVYNLQPAKTFKKAIGVELSFANETYQEVYKLSLFVFDNGEWKPVQSKVNKKNKTVTASLTTLGKVKLGIDANKKEELDLPQTFALIQNYPNPFNPSTIIAFHLPEDCDITVEIYNMLGAKITTLRSGFTAAGRYSVTWNGMNDAKVQVPSGIYLYRLKTNKFDQVRKMILLK